MEVISIDNKEYVRASQLAKRFKYTTDYIGQLCRSGKVDSKLVGRTWYVNPESLEEHRGTRYVKTSSDEKTNGTNVKIKISRQDVESVVRKETARSLADTKGKSSNFLRRIEWKPLKYEVDTADLLPPLQEGKESVRVNVEIAESTKIAIKNMSRDTKMVTEALPEVALTGSLHVSSLDDDFDKDLEKDLENIVISDEDEQFNDYEADEEPVMEQVSSKNKVPPRQQTPASRTEKTDPQNPSYPVAIRQSAPVNFAPARARTSQSSAEPSKSTAWGWWVGIILISFCVTAALLSVEFLVTATSSGESISFILSRPIF
jgi:hypothetical protein